MHTKTKNKKFRAPSGRDGGFTIIELMVVFAIIVILAIYTVAAYSEAFPRLSLDRTVEGFISDVSNVKKKSSGSVAYLEGGEVKRFDYGIFFEKEKEEYIIFIDKNDNKEYNTGEEEKIIEAEKGVKICELSEHESNKLSLLFSEDGTVYFNGTEVTSDILITFCSVKKPEILTEVSINSNGVPEVEM
jgi:prepilin-type N-terminal cleavage/methylation domain-containing protein